MQCVVYRSSKKAGLYVYLPAEAALDSLPEHVKMQLGNAELALTFELHMNRTLGSEKAETVLANLETNGFHVQMPRDIEPLLNSISSELASKPKR